MRAWTDKLKWFHSSDGEPHPVRYLLYISDERRFGVWRQLDKLVGHLEAPYLDADDEVFDETGRRYDLSSEEGLVIAALSSDAGDPVALADRLRLQLERDLGWSAAETGALRMRALVDVVYLVTQRLRA